MDLKPALSDEQLDKRSQVIIASEKSRKDATIISKFLTVVNKLNLCAFVTEFTCISGKILLLFSTS